MAIVYKHIRLDNNEVFYIGIGKNINRAYTEKSRNKIWQNIVNKTKYKIEIIFDNISFDEAKNVEKYLISYYGRKDLKTGSLVNLTIGGDGVVGNLVSEETKDKMRKRMLGFKMSDETKAKISFKSKNISNETRLKMSIASSNRSIDTLKKLSNSKTGKKLSDETKIKISLSHKNQTDEQKYKRKSFKKIKDIETGIVYDNSKIVSELFNIKIRQLQKKLRNEIKNNTNFIYLKNA
jgi:hypothetical protein